MPTALPLANRRRWATPFAALTLWLLIASGCARQSAPEAPPISKTSLRPDSLWAIALPGANRFAFSPIHPDHLWVTAYPDAYDLDLRTGIRQPLSQLLGIGLSTNQLQQWTLDSNDSDLVWLACFERGVVRIQRQTGQVMHLEAPKPATCFAFQKEWVWIGTANGLWRYDRHSGQPTQEANFPNTWVNHIATQGDSLIINEQYFYLSNERRYGEWRAPWIDADCHGYTYQYREGYTLVGDQNQGQAIQAVLTPAGQFQRLEGLVFPAMLALGKEEFWNQQGNNFVRVDLVTGQTQALYSSIQEPLTEGIGYSALVANRRYVCSVGMRGILILQKETGRFFYLPQPWATLSQPQAEIDDYNLYLLRDERFQVFNLDWLLHHAMPAEQYARQAADRNALLAQTKARFNLAGKNFYAALATYDSLRLEYGQDPFFQIDLTRARRRSGGFASDQRRHLATSDARLRPCPARLYPEAYHRPTSF